MESSSYWILFLSAAVAINIAPGPDLLYIISKTIAQGRKIGFASSLGVSSGALVHVFAAALGLSAILATSAIAFSIVKYFGAAYLVYLGIKSLMSKGTTFDSADEKEEEFTPWQAFRQGVLVDVLNPKVAIFFMAFLPQFIRPEMGSTSAQLIGLGILVILIAIVIEFAIVLTAAQTTNFFRSNRKFSIWLDRVLGTVLIGLAVRLALTESPSN
ncbi:MAG: LysE family translocator [Anaerolineae bacterium]|jgi:RhtB (resistance to homoserine/threonine) family protein|nr:LysE family translocator [Anaerolineae bacterium]MBT4310693.1 LysE family translocator [Anaerolineae bacterium]MBT4457869.1 LysE family translocator [Anaerolineae bacterium]MBT4842058.1 LysE family translocator [Anaerolineae bacterium]MBT6060309.1 LysE family translocator [Anaerolineae bacterium]